jgi:uncharacterized protein YhfF
MINMTVEDQTVKEMWKKYLSSMGEDIKVTAKTYESWHFCNHEKDANELAELVKKGIKKATASLRCLYEIENEPIPKVGDYVIITNWKGIAQGIIQITNIHIIPFKGVSEEFAAQEGEGDKTLSFWRKVHRKFFTLELKAYNKKFSEDMLVICEEFEVVYQ